MNDNRAKTGGIELRAQQFFTHSVHADAVKRIGHRGQGADNFEIAGGARLTQRPRAVFAARPGYQGFYRLLDQRFEERTVALMESLLLTQAASLVAT